MQKKVTKRSSKEKEKKDTKNKAKNKKTTTKQNPETEAVEAEPSTRKSEILGVVFVAFGLIALCGLAGLNVGYIGHYVASFLKYFFGIGSAVTALLFVVMGGYNIMKHKRVGFNKTSIGVALLLISLLGLYHHMVIPVGSEILPTSLAEGGGLLGGVLAFILHKPLGNAGTVIVFIAAIIGSVLLATPWSLAQGILTTKAVSEKGADVAMDMAEVVYDNAKTVGSRVTNKVQEHVGEQVQKFKNRNSFYDQTRDDSFMDGPDMEGNSYGQSQATSFASVDEIEPIIQLNKGDNAPTWQAPSPKNNQQPFDGPDFNDKGNNAPVYNEPVNVEINSNGTGLYESTFDGPDMKGSGAAASSTAATTITSANGEKYISEFAYQAAGKLDRNLKKLDTSGYVNIKTNKIGPKTFDNWRLKGNLEADFDDDGEEEILPVADAPESEEDLDFLMEQRENVKASTEEPEKTDTVLEAAEENVDEDEPMVVASIDELLYEENESVDEDDATAETFSFKDNDSSEDSDTVEAAEEAEASDDSVDSDFKIDFSSDHKGESSFTQSLPEDEDDIVAAAIDSAVNTEAAKAAGAAAAAAEVDKLAQAAALSAQAQEEKEELPPYEVPDVKDVLKEVVKEKDDKLESEIQSKAKVLAQTLKDFKVNATILGATHGPAVTRYEVKLAPGVKVNKLTGLADDIALSMAATSVRIEQIPNRSTIGIEVPNRKLESVPLREVLENPAFEEAKSRLTVGFGKDISGKAIFGNLADMPHLLVAGATGSGKSVCINTIVTSILFKAKPDEVKFIMIDPKMVELSVYNDIPHLMVPVVTDARKAASVLNWAVQEMEKRYGLIAQAGVKNIETYNKYYAEEKDKQMSSVVIIIDELADLMMVAPHDVEDAICRLAQKARAAGIYLVLATQRPSVNVITGVIKANIPSRISFAVTSQIDSRTILDSAGAEKLLGKGDMLFKPQTEPKATRVQGAFVSDADVELLVERIKQQGHKLEINQEIIDFTNKAEQDAEAGDDDSKVKSSVDELLRQAVELVMQTGNASASSFQRRYHIGFTRAGRLLDTMEQLKIVGPPQGSKPREILVTEDQAFEIMDKLEEHLKEEK
ncbi:Cell division protein FtsK [Anaerovibrio sp. JC8]|uniref:DNA translocase FtsK n=1 Tax=Anaerovibrio sp. JC8 TaxID=1240085 RepID=UPI000A0D5692|nr:DNA translocase FtsK [Anaerovibrio sp. JC8]ORT99179.1 Cell division protein FtsK [Anaerovibrio sp. JC8]